MLNRFTSAVKSLAKSLLFYAVLNGLNTFFVGSFIALFVPIAARRAVFAAAPKLATIAPGLVATAMTMTEIDSPPLDNTTQTFAVAGSTATLAYGMENAANSYTFSGLTGAIAPRGIFISWPWLLANTAATTLGVVGGIMLKETLLPTRPAARPAVDFYPD